MHTVDKGSMGEFMFAARAIAEGIKVSIPSSPCRYDVITDYNGILNRVQVKTTTQSRELKGGGTGYIWTLSSKISYSIEDIDVFAFYYANDDKLFIVPTIDVKNMDSLKYWINADDMKYYLNWSVLKNLPNNV